MQPYAYTAFLFTRVICSCHKRFNKLLNKSVTSLMKNLQQRCHQQILKEMSQLTPQQQQQQYQQLQMRANQVPMRCSRMAKNMLTGSRLKRLQTGDILATSPRKLDGGVQISKNLFYRVTRSGRIYGKYVNRTRPSAMDEDFSN